MLITLLSVCYANGACMPDFLAIDSTSALCQVGLSRDGHYSFQQSHGRRQHAQQLLPMIEQLLQGAGITVADLDAIAVVVGPGSFTGLRIGIGAAQGLAYAAGIPVIPVSSLATLAMSALSQLDQTAVLVCTEAREGEVYFAAYRESRSLGVRILGSEQVAAVDELRIDFQVNAAQRWAAVGSGWRYLEQLKPGLQGIEVDPELEVGATTEAVCRLAGLAFSQGFALPPEQVQPNYIKEQMHYG